MIYIDPASAVRADIVRLVVTKDQNGNVIDQSFSQIFGEHWVDKQPATNSARVAAEALKMEVTHAIYPEIDPGDAVLRNDFYRIGGRVYRITDISDFKTLRYYSVYEGDFGEPSSVPTFKLFFAVNNVGPGTYTFGAGAFSAVPVFAQAPDVVGLLVNDGSFYIDSVTATGFRLVDRGIGLPPLASIYIWEKPVGVTDVNRWSFAGIGPGVYTFGTSPLTGMPSSFATVPILYTQDNNAGQHYVPSRTTTGFIIADKFTGPAPSVTAVIIRN